MSPPKPEESKKPTRLIVPGQEPEPAESAPKIILPPGFARETPDDLPDFPKLRPLVLMPASDGQRELLVVSDPLGIIEGQPVLGMEALSILQLLDGSVSLNDITTALTRESKDIRVANMVRDFIASLDKMLMLESPRFETAYRERREAYHLLEIRPAVLEGHSYPAERGELVKFLDEHLASAEASRAAETPGATPRAAGAAPRALLAPHLDPRRSGHAIARALVELKDSGTEPLRIVVFGTGHQLLDDRLALTRKHYETTLGRVTTDTRFVDAVAAKLGDAAYHGELAHRDEHSIEFQALYLRHVLGERAFTIVPILCGGFHGLLDQQTTPRDDATFEAMIGAVREAEAALGGRTVYLASVDLSHVGPRFGDAPVDDRVKAEVEEVDKAAIAGAEKGDADAWFAAIAGQDDITRICGFAPTYAMLRCAEPGPGRLLHYEQSAEKDSTIVSIATMVWS